MNVAGARGIAGGVQAPTRPNQPRQAVPAGPETPNQGAAAEPDPRQAASDSKTVINVSP